MRVTKHEHATLRVEESGRTLIIDPGSFTAPLADLTTVDAVVLTHEHPDHWTPEHLARLREEAPGVPVFGPQGVVDAVTSVDVQLVAPGETVTAGVFTLTFYGGRHNVIHESIPVVDNLGVAVDGRLYYPGDSYTVPDDLDVEMLAAPLGAPWLRIGEAMDFVLAVGPRAAFGTHDKTLSEIGSGMHRARLAWATQQGGGVFHELDAGDSIEF